MEDSDFLRRPWLLTQGGTGVDLAKMRRGSVAFGKYTHYTLKGSTHGEESI